MHLLDYQRRRLGRALSFLLILACLLVVSSWVSADVRLKEIKLPPGFQITIYADKVPGAGRSLLAQRASYS